MVIGQTHPFSVAQAFRPAARRLSICGSWSVALRNDSVVFGSAPAPGGTRLASNCIVTAGPTYEPLDDVRRLTNFSTGRLGTELANFLVRRGHQATLAGSAGKPPIAASATPSASNPSAPRRSCMNLLRGLAAGPVDAIFHAAAVSDFAIGRVWSHRPGEELKEIKAPQAIHPPGHPARGTGAHAQDHRRTARMVPRGKTRGLEI